MLQDLPATSTLPWPLFFAYSSAVIAALILFALILSYIGAEMSGWKALQALYPDKHLLPQASTLQAIAELGLLHLRVTFLLSLGADEHGLYLAMKPLQWLGFCPIYLPWEDVTVRKERAPFAPRTVITASRVSQFLLVLPGAVDWPQEPHISGRQT